MSNSKRSIIFVGSFLIAMLLFMLILSNFGNRLNNGVIFFSFVTFIAIVIFPMLQCLMRFQLLKKFYSEDKLFFTLKIKESKIYQRVIFHGFVFLIIIFPVVGTNFNFSNINTKILLTFIVWAIIGEFIIQWTYKKTKVNFMNDGLLIIGHDLRIDLPLSNALRSHSGMYGYYELSAFELVNGNLKLYLDKNRGHIITNLPEDKKEPITQFLIGKNILNNKK